MKKICCIVGACVREPIIIPERDACLVIAADGGLRYLAEQGIAPDLTVGDFDSLGYVPREGTVIEHPVEKDDTDTMLAIKLGLERGCDTFLLCGCTGGRPDHAYANLQALLYIAQNGARGYLVGDGWVSCAIRNAALEFPEGFDGTISVFCPDGLAGGVDLAGLYYSLQDGTLSSGFPLGVSNHFIGEKATVSVRDGALLVMWEETARSLAGRVQTFSGFSPIRS